MSHNLSGSTVEIEGTSSTHFDDTTIVRRLDDADTTSSGVFAADLDESWASLLGVHGGYVTSLTVRAAEALLPGREVRTVAASFLPPMIKHFGQADLLIDPATIPIGGAEETRVSGHVRPIEVRPFDAAWLTMIGDWFPPSPFRRFAPPTGGVSVDYTVHVHRTLPAARDMWLEGVFEARTSSGAIALERGTLATADGVAVAETFHTRWTA
ncbi:MAG: hypothetical protein JWN62_446 [Acidimicrobiales bacterium]|nr:hypothetical protein [Acidimicrobiales bacterium]